MNQETRQVQWLTPAEVAGRWRRSTDTILRWCKRKLIPAMPLPGGSYLIHRDTVNAREHAIAHREVVRVIRNARRNRRYQSSGIDHFGQ